MALRISRLGQTRDLLGESPVWDAAGRRLLWIDSLAGTIHELDFATGRLTDHQLPPPLGCVALNDDGRIVVALRDSVVLYEPGTRAVTEVAAITLPAGARLNDGVADPEGCFLIGSMHRPADGGQPMGALFRVTGHGNVETIDRGLGVVNGPCTSRDGSQLYVADSAARRIYRYEVRGGSIGSRQPFVDAATLDFTPDGAAVDEEGFVWTCLVRSAAIARFSPSGDLDRLIPMPTAHPTSLAFVGDALDALVVTSISKSTLLAARDGMAGALLLVEGLEVRGREEARTSLRA